MTVSFKQMISGGMAAVLAVVLALPSAHAANTWTAHDPRERYLKGGGAQNLQQPRSQRPYAQRRESGDEQRPQRMSAEERRQLRRDIKDAGREIYLPPR